MNKRLVSTIVILVILAVLIAVPVVAAESAVITVSNTTALPGDTVQVTVSVTNNPGLSSLRFSVGYDNWLVLTDVEFNSSFGEMVTTPKPFANPLPITLISPLVDTEESGVLATLTFKVAEDAPNGHVAQITITHNPKDVFNSRNEEVPLQTADGKVFIYHSLPGDVDGDGKVNTKDAIALFRYVAGWNVAVDEEAIDVNDDGRVNTKDAIALFRYVAGWDVLLVRHVHSLTKVEAKEATCTEDGNIEYYYCEKCGGFYSDASGKNKLEAEDVVIEAIGHGEHLQKIEAKEPTVDEPGNVEYWKCSKCGKCYSDANAEHEIDEDGTKIWAVCHTITYYNLKGAPKPELTRYAENLGVDEEEMPQISVPGYDFIGWQDDSGKRVHGIPAGSTKDYVLYAVWSDPVEYTITYRHVWGTDTTRTYTVEDSFEILTPQWRGLLFSHWEDQSGKLTAYTDTTGVHRLKLEKGTIGDIELIARWYAPENWIVPKTDNQIKLGGFDEGTQLYWFVFELGSMKNVVLDEVLDTVEHRGIEFPATVTNTVEISKGYAEVMSDTVSRNVTTNTNWQQVKETTRELTASVGTKVTTGVESSVGKENVASVTAKLEMEVSAEIGASYSRTLQDQTGGSVDDETGIVKEIGSTFSYNSVMSTEKSFSQTLGKEDAYGYYKFAHIGDITTYAFVVYDPETETYFLEVYNRLGDMRTGVVYRPFETEIPEDAFINGTLSYDLDQKIILEAIKSSYYIKYDGTTADGGEAMDMSVHPVGQTTNLAQCTYTKAGYHLAQWWTNADLTGTKYEPEESVTDLAEPGQTVILYADWELTPYTVNWEMGAGYSIKVKRTSSPNANATTGELEAGATVYYGDVLSVTYTSDTGYHLTSQGETTIVVEGNVDSSVIYATAGINSYTVVFNANGGSGSMNPQMFTYGTSANLTPNAFTRHGWLFRGWKDDNGKTYKDREAVSNLTTTSDGTVTLYAQWSPIVGYEFSYDTFFVANDATKRYTMYLDRVFDLSYIQSQGMKMKVKCTYTAEHQDNDGHIVNYLRYNNEEYKYAFDFESTRTISWEYTGLTVSGTSLIIDFTSGDSIWTWDRADYNVPDLKVWVEFYYP